MRPKSIIYQPKKGSIIVLVCFSLAISLLTSITSTEASCFLSYDSAQVLDQGDGLARLSLHGGNEGLGTHIEGRLGLSNHRSIHLRTGSCERQDLWGWGLEAGFNQEWLSQDDTGFVDLGFRLSATLFLSDDEDNAYSSIGIQPVFLISYPFSLTADDQVQTTIRNTRSKRLSNTRQGFIGMSVGMSAGFIDQRQRRIIEEGADQLEEMRLNSDMEWQPLLGINGSVDIIPHLPLSLEIRWQQRGLYGGAAIGYQF